MAATGMRFLGSGHPPLHRFRLGLEFVISGHREVDGMIEPPRRDRPEPGGAARAARRGARGDRRRHTSAGTGADGRATSRARRCRSRRGSPQVAEYVEVANRMGGVAAVRELVRERRGGHFDPALADLRGRRGGGDPLGPRRRSATWDAVIEAEPALAIVLAGERFDAALLAIANFVDLKSPYFLGHARAVADLAAEAGARLGLSDARGAHAAPRRAGARPRPAGDLQRHLGQARAAGRGRMGARPPPALPDRAHAPPVARRWRRWPRSPCSTASASTARATRAGSPGAGISRRRGSSGPPTPTRRCASPARTARRAPRRRRPPSCGPTSRPAATTPRPSRRCSAPPAIASRAAARARRG